MGSGWDKMVSDEFARQRRAFENKYGRGTWKDKDKILAKERARLDKKELSQTPEPSIPSISNVGSTAFTGVVNQQAVPAGFQALPASAGANKKIYQLSQFHEGVNQSSSPRDISENECQEAKNITFSSIGSIKLLGDCKNTENSITTHAVGTTNRCTAGYGLFQFTAPADKDDTTGETVITYSADGDRVDSHDAAGLNGNTQIDFGGNDNDDTAFVFYAAGNGVYVADANFANTGNARRAKMYVNRSDINGTVGISGWVSSGKALIDSPDYSASTTNDVEMKGTHNDAGAAGRLEVAIMDANTGTWNGTYFFYISWLFDGGTETGLTCLGSDNGFSNETCELNVSIHHANGGPVGGDKRIEGARIYFMPPGTKERYLLAEVSLVEGIKGALDSTFTPWEESATNIYHLGSNIVFEDPPEVYTYQSLNGYAANEVYSKSPNSTSGRPTAYLVYYKTAVVGQGGIVYIGNVKFNGTHRPDAMMFSMPGKPGVFPLLNTFDSPSSDGSAITALAAYGDTILQFKENGLYIINISNPEKFYAEAAYRDCGVHNPCQVFTASFGIIFANKHGCYIYDGSKIISLTGGKFDDAAWDLPNDEGSAIGDEGAGVPSVGYDPRSQNIIVLKDINDDSTDQNAWVYNMPTQSWTEGIDIFTNAAGGRHTNFIVSAKGYLSFLIDDVTTLYNYSQGQASGNAQTVTYITKDIDFGFPNQTKKIFKIYVTYQGDANALTGTCGLNGDSTPDTAMTNAGTSDATLTNHGVADHTVATFTIDSQPDTIKSIALKFTGSCGEDFQINDITIVYRLRPIK